MATSKSQIIQNWVSNNVHTQFSTTKLAAELNVSLPTLLGFIKANPQFFKKIKHGTYEVIAYTAVTPAASANAQPMTQTVVISNSEIEDDTNLQSNIVDRPFDW